MKRTLLVTLACASLAACGGGSSPPADDTATSDTAAPSDASSEVASTGDEDATVPGTEYNATTQVDCGFEGAAPNQKCDAGVIRDWGEAGQNLVEVQKPDGFKRAIFFNGTEPYGADSAEADGSAGWDFETSREGDRITVNFGPETYVIVEAMITGG